MTILLKSVQLSDGTSSDILVENGVIAEMGSALSRAGATQVNAEGLIALPGLVDLHTHLRQPGGESSETVLSGTRAAAAGGFTAVLAMANTTPVQDTAGVVEQVQRLGEEAGFAQVQPIGAVTKGLEGTQLAALGAMARSRAQVRVFSDDGHCVHDSLLMRRALEYVKSFNGVIAQHAQDPRLTVGAQMNEGELSARLGLAGWPAVAEESIIARDVLLAETTGSRLHICHVSTAGSVEVLRWAKSRGIAVTAEVTPHHLLLTEQLVANYDTHYKVNPPLRSQEDTLALQEALLDGTIDIVATDHAPHSAEKKHSEWDQAAFGMVGLETALQVVQTALGDRLPDWAFIERVLSSTPARIAQLQHQGLPLAVGNNANIVLYDPTAVTRFGVENIHSKSKNSPFLGETLHGAVQATLYRGSVTYSRDHNFLAVNHP